MVAAAAALLASLAADAAAAAIRDQPASNTAQDHYVTDTCSVQGYSAIITARQATIQPAAAAITE